MNSLLRHVRICVFEFATEKRTYPTLLNTMASRNSTSSRCKYCHKDLDSDSAVKRHIAATPGCKSNWEKEFMSVPPNVKKNARKSTAHLDPSQFSMDDTTNWDNSHSFIPDASPGPSKWARVEEVEDEDDVRHRLNAKTGRFAEVYPCPVGTPVGEGKTKFERLFEEQEKRGESNWAPFASEEEWQLARWLSQRVGHKAIDEYLKLPIVCF